MITLIGSFAIMAAVAVIVGVVISMAGPAPIQKCIKFNVPDEE